MKKEAIELQALATATDNNYVEVQAQFKDTTERLEKIKVDYADYQKQLAEIEDAEDRKVLDLVEV